MTAHLKPQLSAVWNMATLSALLSTLCQRATARPIASAAECASLTAKDRVLGECVMCSDRRQADGREVNAYVCLGVFLSAYKCKILLKPFSKTCCVLLLVRHLITQKAPIDSGCL